MIRLLTDGLWTRVTKCAKSASSACVAIAYVGTGARRLLPLKKDSILVVDLSEASVKAGTTNPHEVLKFIRAGVRVHSRDNLHAKVLVFPHRAIIGSSNASRNSAHTLVEAALETTDSQAVKSARVFVKSLTGDPIGPEYCKKMIKLYKPPKWGHPTRKPKSRKKAGPAIARKHIWVVPLVTCRWDKVETQEARKGRKTAMRRLSTSAFKLNEFLWEGSGLGRIGTGDRLLQNLKVGRDRMISPPGKVVHIRRFRHEGQEMHCVYVEVQSASRRLRLSKVRTAIGTALAVRMRSAERVFCVRDNSSIGAIEVLWA